MNFIQNESAQKLRGGYYTHQDIAHFLTRWVIQPGVRQILEPSCGDGNFFEAISATKGRGVTVVNACELDAEEAAKARERARSLRGINVTVHSGDFLQWAIDKNDTPPDMDGVLGNPPFIRYQYLGAKQQDLARQIFDRHALPFTKHTNAWAPFVIASIARLRAGGRLGMVVPAELLHVLHAQSVRQFLLSSCSRVMVFDPETLWFDGTLQGVVLLLAEKREANDTTNGKLAISKLKSRASLLNDPCKLVEQASFIDGATVAGKWMPALLTASERVLLAKLTATKRAQRFAELARVDVGIITGANSFFLVADEIVDMYGLRSFAHPMFGRSGHVRGVIYDDSRHDENRKAGLAANFLWFGPTEKSKFSASVRKYIDSGEAVGLHTRFKCRIRKPWYDVPSVHVAPVGMLKRSHDFPRMILNRASALSTDTAYRIRPNDGVCSERLVSSFVNSLTALSAELEGRSYGGGVLELVPSEIERLLIPWGDNARGDINALDNDMCAHHRPEEVLAAQDQRILHRIGIRTADSEMLLAAWLRLRNRRQRNVSDDESDVEQEDALMPVRLLNMCSPKECKAAHELSTR